MNLEEQYDAIVIGTGISGGWAAKELCEGGLKTLVLERGRMVKHIEDYPTMNDDDWDYPYKGELSQVHNVPNVYVTDGAFMTSSNCVNPSLTYMAFTARAANHAITQFKAGKYA